MVQGPKGRQGGALSRQLCRAPHLAHLQRSTRPRLILGGIQKIAAVTMQSLPFEEKSKTREFFGHRLNFPAVESESDQKDAIKTFKRKTSWRRLLIPT